MNVIESEVKLLLSIIFKVLPPMADLTKKHEEETDYPCSIYWAKSKHKKPRPLLIYREFRGSYKDLQISDFEKNEIRSDWAVVIKIETLLTPLILDKLNGVKLAVTYEPPKWRDLPIIR